MYRRRDPRCRPDRPDERASCAPCAGETSTSPPPPSTSGGTCPLAAWKGRRSPARSDQCRWSTTPRGRWTGSLGARPSPPTTIASSLNPAGEMLRRGRLDATPCTRALEAVGIDRKAFPARAVSRFHDLRHTFGTLGAQVFPLHDRSRRSWATPTYRRTMRYAHSVPKVDAAATLHPISAGTLAGRFRLPNRVPNRRERAAQP